MTRLFERTDHDFYGECRRCWVMLVGLYGTDLTVVDQYYGYEWGVFWDDDLAELLDTGVPEGLALRIVLQRILDVTPD